MYACMYVLWTPNLNIFVEYFSAFLTIEKTLLKDYYNH